MATTEDEIPKEGLPLQKKRTQKTPNAPLQSKNPGHEYEKLYLKLVQCHEQVGKAFQQLQMQNEDLTAEFEEKNWEIKEQNKVTQELADLVQIKETVIEDLKKSLVRAKTCISAIQEEIRSLQVTNIATVDKEPGEQTAHRVSAHNLESIHEHYSRVPAILQKEHGSMAKAC